MAAKKNPLADKAYELYKSGMKLVEIADQLGKPEGTIFMTEYRTSVRGISYISSSLVSSGMKRRWWRSGSEFAVFWRQRSKQRDKR